MESRSISRRRFLDSLAQITGGVAALSTLHPSGRAYAQSGATGEPRLAAASYDVVVVGGGLAGSVIAVIAAQGGARVALIDKASYEFGDGNVLMAAGAYAAGGRDRFNPDAIYADVMSQGVAYPDLAKAFAATCARSVDFLRSCGVEIAGSGAGSLRLEPDGEVNLVGPIYRKDTGRKTLQKLRARFERAGGVTLRGVEGVRLIAEQGQVRGIVARRGPDMVDLRARAVALTTGGFSNNPEMLRRYIGPGAALCRLRGSKNCTGDALRMALDAGAKAVNLEYFYGHLQAINALVDDRFWPFPRLDVMVNEGILINPSGSRFADEGRQDIALANDIARSEFPRGCALIFDEATWKRAADTSVFNLPPANPWFTQHGADLYERNTAEQIGTALGMDPAQVARTVSSFNESAKTGRFPGVPRSNKARPLEGKLYGLKVVPGITFTMGGVLINGRGQVLNAREEPIAGLYAAGDAIGGLMGGYRGGYHGGLTQAVVTGMLAGETLASVLKT